MSGVVADPPPSPAASPLDSNPAKDDSATSPRPASQSVATTSSLTSALVTPALHDSTTQKSPTRTANPDTLANAGESTSFEVVKLEEVADPNTFGSVAGEDTDAWAGDTPEVGEVFDPDLKRVKVYELVGSRWTDRGTAFCQGDFDHDTHEAKLVARAESDTSNIILSCTIRGNDVYQKQQDTLIVWTEPDGTDWALSFQEAEGCSEVWDFIVEVQRHLNVTGEFIADEAGPSSSPQIPSQPSPVAAIIRSGQLPAPALGVMRDIEQAIKILARTPVAKERVCELIRQQDYLRSMIDVMQQAEDLESIENLHALCTCMTTILLLNDHTMYEYILDDDIFLGVVGILEYDPEFPGYKANYRDFLSSTSQYKQPIPFSDPNIQTKIRQTYRLQYLKDVILARSLDDSSFNVLNSCIIFNQIDIINHVQSDDQFLGTIVGLFVDTDTLAGGGIHSRGPKPIHPDAMDGVSSSKDDCTGAPDPTAELSEEGVQLRRDVVFLVHQLCSMGKNVQLPARVAVFRTLVDRGVLFAVQWALTQSDQQIVHAAGEILAVLLDHDTGGVRAHVLKQVQAFDKDREAGKKDVDKKMTLMQLLCHMMAGSIDLSVQNQLGDALRVLLEVPQGDMDSNIAGLKMLSRPKDDPSTERFLEYTYKACMESLMKPLLNAPDFKSLTDTPSLEREKSNLYLYSCDLLCNFLLQHSFRSHFFVLTSNVSPRIASFLFAKDKHLCLAALRFFRICLKLNNRNMHNHLMKHEVIGPIVDLAMQESKRDNLLNASCQEFFEYMRKENPKELIAHCMDRYEAKIRALADTMVAGPRFKAFVRRWEMNVEPAPMEENPKPERLPSGMRWWKAGLEREEEDWFNKDDDDDPSPTISSPLAHGAPRKGIPFQRRRGRGGPMLTLPARRQLRTSKGSPASTTSLVDYPDDDDDDAPPTTSSSTSSSIPTGKPPSSVSSPTPQHGPPIPTPISIPPTPSVPSPGLSPLEPGKLAEKRRREDEDDDDELLERLAKAKRPNVTTAATTGNKDDAAAAASAAVNGNLQNKSSKGVVVLGGAKQGEEGGGGPKKIKMKIGTIGASFGLGASKDPPPPPGSNSNSKDSDGG